MQSNVVVLLLITACLLVAGCNGGHASAVTPVVLGGTGSAAARGPIRSASAIAQVALSGNYDNAILADKVTAYYRIFDVTTLLHDIALNPKHGNHGTAEKLGVPGLTSMNYSAALFPGGDYDTSRFANVLPTPKLQPSIVSVEAWVDASAANISNRYQPIVAYGRFSSGTPYNLTITPINQFFFSIHTATGSPSVVSTTTSTAGRIYHVVGTYDGTTLKIYVNGVLEGQAPASGAIDYLDTYSWSGLAIGSGYDAAPAHPIESYAGTIANVGIYNYALTGAQVLNHYLVGVLTPVLTERPAWSDALVDSIGVNAPFNYQGTSYDTQYQTVKSALIASGIRHIRSGLAVTTWQTYYQRLNELGLAGIHSQLVASGTETASQLQSYPTLVAQSMEAFEGPNEPDLRNDPNWIVDTQNFMHMMYGAVKGYPPTARLPVLGPSVTAPADMAAYGNTQNDLDFGNIHPYYGPNNPGNYGTGSIGPFGRSGSIPYFLGIASQISGSKPVFASETGFSTGDVGTGNVSELCDGKEAPRLYFDHFNAGIVRTEAYQFVESGTLYGELGSFSYMGFLRQDLSPKPSYQALKALIALLADPGTPFTTAPLTYTISGDINNLDHLLMEKRNGTYYLALWLEVPSWNTLTNTDIITPPQAITINLPASASSGAISTLSDAGLISTASLAFNQGRSTVQISDRITVIAFHP